MTESTCDVLIVGGGVGGCAAAMAAAELGAKVIITEPTDWVGGQLTSQAVPPDEHPWIEEFGCTARYRSYRSLVRDAYRNDPRLTDSAKANPILNPGGGWVSGLCHDPRIGEAVLGRMLAERSVGGNLSIRLRTTPQSALVLGDFVSAVRFVDADTGQESVVSAKFVLDATELGDLLPMVGAEYVVGAESRDETDEPHAPPNLPEPDNVQGFTWVAALAYDAGSHRTIDRPSAYDRWRSYKPNAWPGPLLGLDYVDPPTGKPKRLPIFRPAGEAGPDLFGYRQIVDATMYKVPDRPHPATAVNWPQNDYFLGTIIDVSPDVVTERLEEARQLTLSLVYWLQTEAPRPDGGQGHPGLYLEPALTGTLDGLAKAPYVRESRRIRAEFTAREPHVSAAANPGLDRAPPFYDSVGIGAYRIDLHPSCSGAGYVDIGSLPFQVPVGSLVPVRMRNLLPACKNLGVSHIANGCYRLHPVEWAIGEAAGCLAAHCVANGLEPSQVRNGPSHLSDFQTLLRDQGAPCEWPVDRQLRPL